MKTNITRYVVTFLLSITCYTCTFATGEEEIKETKQEMKRKIGEQKIVSSGVFPLSFDKKNNSWNVLLGFNPKNNVWEIFWIPFNKQFTSAANASFALNKQTNGIYNITMNNTMPMYNDGKGHIVYFAQVPWKSIKENYKKMHNKFRTDWAWVSINNLLNNNGKFNHKNQTASVGPMTFSFIQKYWNDAQKQLGGGKKASQKLIETIKKKSTKFATAPNARDNNNKPAIKFYGNKPNVNSPGYDWLGNFWPSKVTINIAGNKYTFPNAEAAFQAGKFYNPKNNQLNHMIINNLMGVKNGDEAWRIGQLKKFIINPTWTRGGNEEWMEKVIIAKFSQNNELRDALVNTGMKTELLEDSPRDSFWGIGSDGKGKNKLGKTLMQVRKYIHGN